MALDRQSIEKKDFPIGRRGYEPDAVDVHLQTLADEIDELRTSSRRRSETLASAASDQVRAIVEAAEQSAAELQRQAEEEAKEIRAEATDEAQRTRQQATEQARDYVGKVNESTSVMLGRVDAMESELDALVESLRTGANRLNADLALLEGNLSELTEASGPRPRFEPEVPAALAPDPVFAPELEPMVELEPQGDPQPELEADMAALEPAGGTADLASEAPRLEALPGTGGGDYRDASPDAEPDRVELRDASVVPGDEEPRIELRDVSTGYGDEPPAEGMAPRLDEVPARGAPEPLPGATTDLHDGAADDEDAEGARLIALNMALNGTPRDETDRYLEENFRLEDRAGLLDEVYASVE